MRRTEALRDNNKIEIDRGMVTLRQPLGTIVASPAMKWKERYGDPSGEVTRERPCQAKEKMTDCMVS